MFDNAKGLHGSPRLHADLRDDGWVVTKKTVADSMRRQCLVARKVKHRRGLTRQDKTAPAFPDRVKRDFTAAGPNLKWCGDITEIPTGNGKLYLATVIDLYSRRLLAAATSLRCDAELCEQAIKIAATVRGGKSKINNVVFHTDRGSTYTARSFTRVCSNLGVRQVRTTGGPPCQCSGEFIDPRLGKTRTKLALPVDKQTSAMTKGE